MVKQLSCARTQKKQKALHTKIFFQACPPLAFFRKKCYTIIKEILLALPVMESPVAGRVQAFSRALLLMNQRQGAFLQAKITRA
nr:hypothetical protein [Fournierella massiliensis]